MPGPNSRRFLTAFLSSRKGLVATGLIGGSFAGGYAFGVYQERRISQDPEHAMSVIQRQPGLTWRFKYLPAGKFSNGGRDGGWVSLYKPRFTGAAGYVVFTETSSNEKYMLLTVQERLIQGKKVMVCEPPIGFFNGEYTSPRPHVVTESAEREIESQIKQGNIKVNHREIYASYMQRYLQGELPQENYAIDADTLGTLFREVKEEAGLDILSLQEQEGVKVTKRVFDMKETPDVCCVVYQVNISGDKLPKLEKRDNDEVKHNEWVPLSNINMQTKMVTTTSGIFPLKPYDKVPEHVDEVLRTSATSKQRLVVK